MITSPLCVRTLHLFLLQGWQYNKWKGLTPAMEKLLMWLVLLHCRSTAGCGWNQLHVPFCFPAIGSSTSCHNKSKGEQQFQVHCAKLMLRQSLLTTQSFSLSLGPPGQTWATRPLAILGSCSLD